MFSTLTQKLLLGIYIFILLSIPLGAYLVSQQRATIKSSASESKKLDLKTQITPKTNTSAVKQLLESSENNLTSLPSPSPSTSTTIATSFGPTLSLKVTLEGRPPSNQATKLFVGIAEGNLTTNPKFLLNFSVDVPASGQYSGLSLAGLNSGSKYTALLKGSAQIASASTFTMSPSVTNLNSGEAINLVTGDLNDDNVVNAADYSIAQKALGTTSKSSNWNENIDLNKDGSINAFDLGLITKNMGKIGSSGAWTSPIPKTSTPSAGLTPVPVGAPGVDSSSGYWVWIPK